jgi:ribokinase
MDLVMNVDKMPQVGETILAKAFKKVSGGKGANQAVAASRLGANVSMIGKIGNDDNGNEIYKCLEKDKVNTQNIFKDEVNPTGMAIISVNAEGNNSIVVVPGSNMNITKEDINKCRETIINSEVIVAQFETPVEATIEAFKIAKENGVMTILNPAPASEICDKLMSLTDIIIPNDNSVLIPSFKVKAVDTTAAGDGFIGALVSSLNINKKDKDIFNALEEAIFFANKVSSLIVQKQGAQTSLPTIEEIH